MIWPWPTAWPDPYASHDLVSALIGSSLFPALYARSLDGLIEPRFALGPPKEVKLGVRIDLVTAIRPSDVVASIAAAKAGAARVLLRDVPVPRVESNRSVLFPGFLDTDGLMKKLVSPLVGIARFDVRRLEPTGPYSLKFIGNQANELAIFRHGLPINASSYAMPKPLKPLSFSLIQGDSIAESLRKFEEGESDIGWLGDGLFASVNNTRTMNFGALAYVALRTGKQIPVLSRPGFAQELADAIHPNRLVHLGLLRRGFAAPLPTGVRALVQPIEARTPVIVRQSLPILVEAAKCIAQEFSGSVLAVNDAEFQRTVRDGQFAIALDIIRPSDESADGATMALVTFDETLPPSTSIGPRATAMNLTAAIGWQISILGAQESHTWIPRSAQGGFDLEQAAKY